MMSLAFLQRRSWLVVCAALWLASVVAGFAGLAAYDNRPGTAAAPPPQWPAETSLARDPDGPTLVMLTHPRCSCSRASVAELAEIVARARHRPKVYVVFIRPGAFREGWEETDLWQDAARIPGAVVVRDDDGVEADRFGAETSGQTMLYDADGELLFTGGITGSRGHAGDNPGRAAVLSQLNRAAARGRVTPVFGCPLFGGDHEGHVHTERDHHDG